jgi:Mn2+/Fe2+ NRAMP family transporter
MDWFAKLLGFIMIGLTLYVAITSHPPVAAAVKHSFVPEVIDTTAIVTLVGGTVGGYISFAGAHRLLDAGITGRAQLPAVSKSSVQAILLASVMRVLLFLAALGVVVTGAMIDKSNPAASVFRVAAGDIGYRVFGVVLWCAAITSVVGSAYTSVSFLRTFHPFIEKHQRILISCFIIFSTAIFAMVGRPVQVLVIVGTLNGFILPVALGLMLLAVHKQQLMKGYKHPLWMQVMGWLVVAAMSWMLVRTII